MAHMICWFKDWFSTSTTTIKDFDKGSYELGECPTKWTVRPWDTRIPSPLSLTSSGYKPAPKVLWCLTPKFCLWSKSLLWKERFHTPSYILTCQHHSKIYKGVGYSSRESAILSKPNSMQARRRFWNSLGYFTKSRLSTPTLHQRGCATSFYIRILYYFAHGAFMY